MTKISIFIYALLLLTANTKAQSKSFTHQDTLRGSIGQGRLNWDVLHYDITVQPDFNTKTIRGINILTYYDRGIKRMQIDLQQPMQIDSMTGENGAIKFTREGNVFWAEIRDTAKMYKIKPGTRNLTIYFSGKPREAVKPPWDGGWIWQKDKEGNPWISVACQGLGASVWYPCKDTQADEPDSGANLHIIVPDSLTAVGNGRLTGKQSAGKGNTMYSWKVISPINNYAIVPYIGKYIHFSEVYNGVRGKLDMDYWVLSYNVEKARVQFKDAPKMMKAFEYWFGPFPFYEDGYKLVEAPYLGMEHQSAVAYGNGYMNGYKGIDLSGSGWGKKWDFIIVHESGHEWFANNITTKDIADMWVHEGFTNYSETLFTEYYYGKEAGNDYVIGLRKNIVNDEPVIAPYGVNKEGSSDMYYKAANMIHMIRQIINNDKRFRKILTGLNKTFYHQTITTEQAEAYINSEAKKDFSKIFDQYLRTTKIPVLEYSLTDGRLSYRYTHCVPGFNMPLKIDAAKVSWIYPTDVWQSSRIKGLSDSLKIDRNFYIKVQSKAEAK